MKLSRRRTLLSGLAAVAASSGYVLRAGAEETPHPLAVVVGAASSLDALSFYQLKRLYLGDPARTPAGQRLIPLNRGTNTAERVGFDQTVLSMNPEQVARYWIDRRIRGQSGAPKAVDPAGILLRILTRVPGTIGYVRLDQVTNAVRVVRISGRMPDHPDYPIIQTASASRLMLLRGTL